MKVKLHKGRRTIDVSEPEAQWLIDRGYGGAVNDKATESKTETETAEPVRRGPRRRSVSDNAE